VMVQALALNCDNAEVTNVLSANHTE